MTRLSAQAVSMIADRLVGEGLLLRLPPIRGRVGQPSVPLALNPDGAYSIGVQVGRRGLEMLVIDFAAQVREKKVMHYAHPNPDEVLPEVASMLRSLRRRWHARWSQMAGLGLSAPLSMDQWAELMDPSAASHLAKWKAVDLLARVQAMTDLPVVFAKDTLAACTAELLQGHGRRLHSYLYLFVGTFVGGGLVLAGQLHPGEHGNAGAIGSLLVGRPGGDLEPLLARASGWTLERSLLQAGRDPLLVQDDAINDAAMDAFTRPWLQSAAQALAQAVINATALLDLDAVVLDGSMAGRLLGRLIQSLREALAEQSSTGLLLPRHIVQGQTGPHARALGGALLPLHARYFPDRDMVLKPAA